MTTLIVLLVFYAVIITFIAVCEFSHRRCLEEVLRRVKAEFHATDKCNMETASLLRRAEEVTPFDNPGFWSADNETYCGPLPLETRGAWNGGMK